MDGIVNFLGQQDTLVGANMPHEPIASHGVMITGMPRFQRAVPTWHCHSSNRRFEASPWSAGTNQSSSPITDLRNVKTRLLPCGRRSRHCGHAWPRSTHLCNAHRSGRKRFQHAFRCTSQQPGMLFRRRSEHLSRSHGKVVLRECVSERTCTSRMVVVCGGVVKPHSHAGSGPFYGAGQHRVGAPGFRAAGGRRLEIFSVTAVGRAARGCASLAK